MANELRSLLARVEATDPATAKELSRHIDQLQSRRQFGLNFERHIPESVELVGRPISVGDKVRFIPPRGEAEVESDATWIVTEISGGKRKRVAHLVNPQSKEEASRSVDDLVYVAEFRDPIYPGLRRSCEPVLRGGDKPFHTVINAENYHALEAMLFTHRGKVDCIYIDPPYNTGARDWKYNNDYVEGDDHYRHSKWLAFIERRLLLARRLLNPENSVLIVTIDEKEYLRLGLLLEQLFPHARLQMVSSLINPAGGARSDSFGRSDEYVFFVAVGEAMPQRVRLSREWVSSRGRTHTGNLRWDLLRRSGKNNAARSDRPNLFYPIYVDPSGPKIVSVGDALGPEEHEAKPLDGLVAVLPIRKDGTEGNWQAMPSTLRSRIEQGRVRVTGSEDKGFTISTLKDGEYKKVLRGEFEITGYRPDGSLKVADVDPDQVFAVPSTQWRISSHDATQYGTRLLDQFLPNQDFPFPKSLYAVEDAIRFFVSDKPDAIVLDFFAGSGTSAHAVARLNRQDGGTRSSIVVTNNEVSHGEAKRLTAEGHRPGDPEWEALGIFDQVTRPRIEAAITGTTPDGGPVRGDYKFADEFPMSEGFEENVEFFTLTYENPAMVELDLAFERIAPLLWMRAGSQGRRIEERVDTFDVADRYGVLFRVDSSADFLAALEKADGVRVAFIVTDDESQFQSVASQLPEEVDTVRLYETYLRTFEINTGRT